MACPEPDHVLAYFARTLDPEERDAIEAHVDVCSACRMLLADLVRTDLDEVVPVERARDPEQIGRYRIESRLGEGGMGTVYAAYDAQLDRRVAIKLVHPELARRGVDRLLREGRALAQLSHRNVVAVHDAGTDGDRVYIVMELVAGQTLADWLRAEPRTWRAIVGMFVAAARGLAAAHHAGIIHRDVKPENVMIDRDGCAKVTDFGLADHSEPPVTSDAPVDPASRITQPGAIVGTPAFMSPEQRRGAELGPATDQYSLCSALRGALLAGRTPRRVPGSLRRALERGLANDPRARFASLDALIAAIDPARRSRRRMYLAIATVVVGLGAAGVAAVVLRHDDPGAVACGDARAARARLWTAVDRDALRAAFTATGVPYASETWTRVDAAAGEYVRGIATAEAGLCDRRPATEAAHVELARGLACLAARRDELAAYTTRARTITAADVRFAVASIHELAPLADCTNPVTLAAEHAAGTTPAGRATLAAVREDVRASRTLRRQGAYRAAADRAKAAVDRARSLGGSLLAKALINHGDIAMLVDGFAVGETSYREAVTSAEQVQADEVRALAMANLMAALVREPGREKEALALEPLVTAAIARSGRGKAILPIVRQAIGVAQLRLGQADEAVTSFEAALAMARAELPRGDPRMPDYLYPPGVALGRLRRDAEALRYFDEAHRVAAETWGEHHPETARFTINLATKHAALGDCPKALVELAAARAILTGVLPPDAPEHLQLGQAMGACYYIQRDHAAALREYTARQQVLTTAGRTKSAEMAGTWVDIGDVQLDRKEYAAAATSYRTSVAQYEDLLGKHDARLGFPLSRLGETELAAGRPPQAIEALERALAIYAAAKVPSIVAADVTFPLARALWSQPAAHARARTLAREARDAYAAGGPAHAPRVTSVDAWLANHR